jgi:hypothetical protein
MDFGEKNKTIIKSQDTMFFSKESLQIRSQLKYDKKGDIK